MELHNKGAIQALIDQAAKNGGGKISIPKGDWLTGRLRLYSNIELHLEDGARLIFSAEPSDYLPPVFTRWEGTECFNYSPLIYAKDCENVKITGKGELFGNGDKWWHWKQRQGEAAKALYEMAYAGAAVNERVFGTETAALRPQFLQLVGCKDVLLEDFTIKDSPQWTIHPVYCEGLVARRLTVIGRGHNTDGLNPDSCKNVLIEDCYFDTGDDCIAINSGLNEDGWRVNRPCENVEIRNCTMVGGHGAIVIGSAISGGVKNVYAHDCKINGTMQGIRIKSMRGRGGYVKDCRFEDMEINAVTEQAIQLNMFYEFSTVMPKSQAPTRLEGISIRRIRGKGAKLGVQIKGLPECRLRDIVLEDIRLGAKAAMECAAAAGLIMNGVEIKEEAL